MKSTRLKRAKQSAQEGGGPNQGKKRASLNEQTGSRPKERDDVLYGQRSAMNETGGGAGEGRRAFFVLTPEKTN